VVGFGAVRAAADDGSERRPRHRRGRRGALDVVREVRFGHPHGVRPEFPDVAHRGVRHLAGAPERVEFRGVLAQTERFEDLAGEAELGGREQFAEVLAEPRPHAVVEEDAAAPEPEFVGDVFEQQERVLAVGVRPNVVDPRIVADMRVVHLGRDEQGVAGPPNEEEQVAFHRFVREPREVVHVGAGEQHDSVGVGAIEAVLAGRHPLPVGHSSSPLVHTSAFS